jgi:uncharacterized membrane protein YdjX (TVP38/TMEM64 family)
MRISPRLRKILLGLLLVVAIYLGMALLLKAIGLENAQNLVQKAGVLAPVLFVGLCAASLIAAPLSGSSLYVLGGVLFGKEVGFWLSYGASLLGCSINFWISRQLGRQAVTRFVGKKHLSELDKFIGNLKSHHSILYMALIMPLAQDIVSYAVGLTAVRYRHFLVALLPTAALIVAAYIYLGTSILETLIQ